jgi:hypothetical protein
MAKPTWREIKKKDTMGDSWKPSLRDPIRKMTDAERPIGYVAPYSRDPGIVYRREVTPEGVADELWATYTWLKNEASKGTVVTGYPHHHDPSKVAEHLAHADIFVFDSDLLRKETLVFSPTRLLEKWRQYRPPFERTIQRPMFILLDVNLPLIDYDFAPRQLKKNGWQDAIISSMLVGSNVVVAGDGLDSRGNPIRWPPFFGVTNYIFALHRATSSLITSTQPTFSYTDYPDTVPAYVSTNEGPPIFFRGQALAWELAEFARSQVVETKEVPLFPDQVQRAQRRYKNPDLPIPEIQVVHLRERKIENLHPERPSSRREISYRQEVRGHVRRYQSGKRVWVRAHDRYRDLPRRPAPHTVVHVVDR